MNWKPINGLCVHGPMMNVYHRTCKQLEDYLTKNGFQVSNVSRNSIGSKEFYHVESNIPESEYSHTKTSHTGMMKLLGIKNIGIIDFYKRDNMIHQVVLIDEDELNAKYLKRGNLVFQNGDCTDQYFKTTINMIQNVDTTESVLIQLSHIQSYIQKLLEEDGV